MVLARSNQHTFRTYDWTNDTRLIEPVHANVYKCVDKVGVLNPQIRRTNAHREGVRRRHAHTSYQLQTLSRQGL